MNMSRKFIVLLAFMVAASAAAMLLRPTQRISDEGLKINLETMIPKKFGGWAALENTSSQIVNPEQQEKLDILYSQILTRAYVNAAGETIMLSIAYGEDQSDSKQLHYPEVCYPAQGFQITSTQKAELYTPHGNIRVLRLHAEMGSRSEPLTYWSTVGNKVVRGGKEIKLEQLRYGFKGKIPDGLLFRVSSINNDVNSGYTLQQSFVQALMADMNQGFRLRLAGL
jgi:EpsI family protein